MMVQVTIHNPDGSFSLTEEVLEDLTSQAFRPIEPAPFWLAAWDLLALKKSDVLASITDPDARYEAELQIEGRKTYRRDDPMTVQLATLLGYPPEQMDSLWLFVQENYV